MQPKYRERFKFLLKTLCTIGLIIAVIVLAREPQRWAWLHHSYGWIKNLGIWSPLVFMLLFNLGTLCFVPGSLLALQGGILFGVVWGTLYVAIAAILGATLSFWLGRYLFRDWLRQQMQTHSRFQAIDIAVSQEGWKIVLLLRLSPIVPFNLINYILGLTEISSINYLLGTIGILPGIFLYTYLGSLTIDLSSSLMPTGQTYIQMLQWVARLIGLVATVVTTIYLARISKKALAKYQIPQT